MQKILTSREKIIFYLTLCVVIFAALFYFVLGPVLENNDILNKEININKTKFKRYLRLLNNKDYIQAKSADLFSNLDLSSQKENMLVVVLSELENLAKDANIQIIDIRPQAPKESSVYKEALIDLRTMGSMGGYMKFIYDIENSLLCLNIKRFQITARPNTQVLEGIFSISRPSAFDVKPSR